MTLADLIRGERKTEAVDEGGQIAKIATIAIATPGDSKIDGLALATAIPAIPAIQEGEARDEAPTGTPGVSPELAARAEDLEDIKTGDLSLETVRAYEAEGAVRAINTEISAFNPHPLADLFPLMTAFALADLRASIARHGLREPIVTHEGMVLDGRNRLRACIETGIPPVFREWDGPDPLAFVLDANLHRRHLDESQRAMVAARVATLPRGANQHTAIAVSSQGVAAELCNVSVDSIQRARKVIERGTPELVAACDQGVVKVSQAAQLADNDPAYQLAILGKVGEGLGVQEAKRQWKLEKLPTAVWPDRKYRVLYVDAAWMYGNDLARCMTGSTSATDHYGVMSIAELCAMAEDVKSIAMDDAVLFMWVPAPLLEECFEVIRAWGFVYKQLIVWDKVEHNYGNYVSSRAELLLICTRGACTPDVDTRPDNVVSIEKSAIHSQKPERFREIIDLLYPHGPRIELFARQRRAGWDVWGNEVDGV